MISGTINWVKKLEMHDQLCKVRFKFLNTETLPLNIKFWDKVDKVSLDEFLHPETERLPLFVQTMFGIFPKDATLKEGQLFAVLVKFLSGNIIGLGIYQKRDNKDERVYWMPNYPGQE